MAMIITTIAAINAYMFLLPDCNFACCWLLIPPEVWFLVLARVVVAVEAVVEDVEDTVLLPTIVVVGIDVIDVVAMLVAFPVEFTAGIVVVDDAL